MLTKRIIACLDCDLSINKGRVVKGVKFKKLKYAGDPPTLAKKYYDAGIDELVFLDVTASYERRETMVHVVKKTAKNVFMPLTVGGGIREPQDFVKMLKAGADKCSINTAAIKNPDLINNAAKIVGNQAVVVAIDAKKREVTKDDSDKITVETEEGRFWYECSIYGGREFTGVDAISWAEEVASRGAGEILLTSMDHDGIKEGFAIDLTKAVSKRVSIPVIASGGCGKISHFYDIFKFGYADAALAASIFHFNEISISDIKSELIKKNIPIRRI